MPFVKLNFQFMHFVDEYFCCLLALYRPTTNHTMMIKTRKWGAIPPLPTHFTQNNKYLLLPHAGDTETQTKCLQKGEKSDQGSGGRQTRL